MTYLGAVLKAKTLKIFLALEKALTTLKDIMTGNREGITEKLNGNRAHGIQPIVDNYPLSTANRYAFVLFDYMESVPESFYVYERLIRM